MGVSNRFIGFHWGVSGSRGRMVSVKVPKFLYCQKNGSCWTVYGFSGPCLQNPHERDGTWGLPRCVEQRLPGLWLQGESVQVWLGASTHWLNYPTDLAMQPFIANTQLIRIEVDIQTSCWHLSWLEVILLLNGLHPSTGLRSWTASITFSLSKSRILLINSCSYLLTSINMIISIHWHLSWVCLVCLVCLKIGYPRHFLGETDSRPLWKWATIFSDKPRYFVIFCFWSFVIQQLKSKNN